MADADNLTLLLTGDSMITRRASRVDDRPALALIERIRAADVAFTNLEVLPNDFHGYPVQESGGDHMAARSWVIDELVAMGFNLFATAHNHALDYGVEGLLATMARLEERGVSYAGIGRNLGEARLPAFHDTPRGSVALITCSSTFGRGQQAGEQRPDMPGRPGLNPLRTTATYVVSPDELAAIRAIAERLGLERQRQERERLGFSFPSDDPEIFPFGDLRFRAGDEPAITLADLPPDIAPPPVAITAPITSLESLEHKAIEAAIASHSGNLTNAARALGISRTTLYRKMEQYGLERY